VNKEQILAVIGILKSIKNECEMCGKGSKEKILFDAIAEHMKIPIRILELNK